LGGAGQAFKKIADSTILKLLMVKEGPNLRTKKKVTEKVVVRFNN
jgi:hypothetical protein